MTWKTWLGQMRGGITAPVPVQEGRGGEPVVKTTPIRGFTALDIAYPNHLHPEGPPMSAFDIALKLCRDMDVDWFGTGSELKHFSVSRPMRGNDANEDAFGFDFGPFDQTAGDFTHQYTVIVRETTGGGFMLLIQDSAMAFADKTRVLFRAVAADPQTDNAT